LAFLIYKDMAREKAFKSLTHKVNDVDATKGIVEFYSSSFGSRPQDKDSDGDIMVKGCYTKTINENFKRIRHLVNHSKSVGVPVHIKEDEFGLKVTSQLILGKQIGKELFEEYKVYAELGNSMEHSVGFIPILVDQDKDNNVNYIREVKLMDVTTMETWGANQFTPQGALKQYGSVQNAIDTLEALLKGKFNESKLKQIESSLSQIKALVNDEPLSTYQEPHTDPEPSDDTWEKLISGLNINEIKIN
jgi:HK97 family phage prohead protease